MISIPKSRLTAIMTLILSLLALFASLEGLLNKNIYADVLLTGVFLKVFVVGTFSQDIISVLAGLILALLSVVFLKHPRYKTFIVILGLAGYFLYSYGLFVITGLYTSIYLVYLAIFVLSIYSLIWGLTSFETNVVKHYRLPGALRMSVGVFFIVIVLIFVPMWLAALTPYTANHLRPDFYGVFVLDLCVVMPALGVIATMLLRNKSFGNILAGIALMKILTLCLSLAIGESIAPLYGSPANYVMVAIYSALTIFSFVLGVLYILNLKKEILK